MSSESGANGPMIPSTQGEMIHAFGSVELGGLHFHVTSTILSTWIVMLVLFVLVGVLYAYRNSSASRIKGFAMDIVSRLYVYIEGIVGSKAYARKFAFLLGGIFVFIFVGNLVGLFLDWLNLIFPPLHEYLRPINSDLNTTAPMALTVILIAQIMAVRVKGFFTHFGHYLWNFHGHTVAEKMVSFFIGYLHFAGEFIRIGSLSMRLFLNIFVGAILIGVAVFIGKSIPAFHTDVFTLLSLPFWFFELLVAFLQAYIFMTLSSLYMREAVEVSEDHA